MANQKGFSLVSFMVTLTILAIVSYFVFSFLKGEEIAGKGRDVIRLSDMAIFVVATENYFLDHNSYPDSPNVTRISNVAETDPANSTGKGWIKSDLSEYLPSLRVDPINSGQYVYKYRHDKSHYKYEVVLESAKDLMKNKFDGGINDDRYEAGNGKSLFIE